MQRRDQSQCINMQRTTESGLCPLITWWWDGACSFQQGFLPLKRSLGVRRSCRGDTTLNEMGEPRFQKRKCPQRGSNSFEENILRPFPQDHMSQFPQLLSASNDGQEVIAC